MKILFVEDDYDQRQTGAAWLSQMANWQAETAENGNEGLLKVQTFLPDVLITDNQMPVMEGTELIRSAREINPAIRTILLSGYSSVHELASECGADASFKKPFNWLEVLTLIASWEK